MNTFWAILVFALICSLLSLKWRNLLFSLGGFLGWIGLWAYTNGYPPTNVTRGSFVHEIILFGCIGMAVGIMVMYLRNRQRGYTGYPMTKAEELEAESRSARRATGLMELPIGGYQRYIHSGMARRRR